MLNIQHIVLKHYLILFNSRKSIQLLIYLAIQITKFIKIVIYDT